MSMEASAKRNELLSSILIIALLGLGLYLYFYLSKPVQQELERVIAEQDLEEKLIEVLSAKLKEKQKLVTTSTSILQQKVPVAPLVDQFLVQLEKIELLTNNQIKSIQIMDNKAEIKIESEPDNSGSTEENSNDEQNEEQGNTVMEIPGQLKRVTFNLQMVAPNYEQMEEFITEIEKLPRISMIDALQFTAPSANLSGINVDEITYQVTLSTFYVENMQELINDLPKVEFIEPSQKKVPVLDQILNKQSIGQDARMDMLELTREEGKASLTSQHPEETQVNVNPPALSVPMNPTETQVVSKSADSFSYYALQAGAFTNHVLAESHREALSTKGWPTLIRLEAVPYRLHIGLTTNLVDARALEEYYRKQGEEVYIHSFELNKLPTNLQGFSEGQSLALISFLESSYALLADLSQTSSSGITQSVALEQTKWIDIQRKYHELSEQRETITQILNDREGTVFTKMWYALKEAMVQLEDYQVNNKQRSVLNVQKLILQYSLEYEKLVHYLING